MQSSSFLLALIHGFLLLNGATTKQAPSTYAAESSIAWMTRRPNVPPLAEQRSLGSVIIGKYSLEMSSNYCDRFPNACEYGVPCPWIPTVGFRCPCGSGFAGSLCDTPTSSFLPASDWLTRK